MQIPSENWENFEMFIFIRNIKNKIFCKFLEILSMQK